MAWQSSSHVTWAQHRTQSLYAVFYFRARRPLTHHNARANHRVRVNKPQRLVALQSALSTLYAAFSRHSVSFIQVSLSDQRKDCRTAVKR